MVQAPWLERVAQGEVDNAGFHDRTKVVDIDLEDAIHTWKRDDDAAMHRDRAAGEAACAGAGRDRRAGLRAEPDDVRHFRRAAGNDDDVRQRRLGTRVVLVEADLVGIGERILLTYHLAQTPQQPVPGPSFHRCA